MIELLNIDCMEYMKTVPDKFFDLAIVDPPYGLDIARNGTLNVNSKSKYKASGWDSKKPDPKYFTELKRVSINQIIWGGNYFSELWEEGCKGFVHWDKMNHHDNRSDGEFAWTSFDRPAMNFRYMWDGNRYGFDGKIDGVGKPTIRIHPTEKPIALYSWLLMNFGKTGDKIFDSHLGSGSIAIACHDLKFDLVGCEIDKEYYDAAVKRFENHKKQIQMF